MRDLDRALSEIANIRSHLAAGTIFKGFGPTIIALTGGLAALTASLQLLFPKTFAATDSQTLGLWVAVAIICAAMIGGSVLTRARRHHGPLADQMIINAIQQLLPAGFAGAATGAAIYMFSPANLWLLPALWQMFLALGVFAIYRTLPPATMLVAAWYFLCGVCVLIIAAKTRTLNPLMMGIPFTLGQLLMALALALEEGKTHEQ